MSHVSWEPMQMTREEALGKATAAGEPHELALREINGVPCKVFVNAPPSLRSLFTDTASDQPFIVYDDDRLTFADAYRQAAQIAHVLVNECGVRKGDRVAISMRNFPEWITTFTAVTSVGAIAVAMNALWPAEEMAFGLEDCGARVLVADQERIDRLAQIPRPADLHSLRRTADPGEPGRAVAGGPDRRPRRGGDAPGGHCSRRSRHHLLHLGLHRAPEGRGLQPPQRAVRSVVVGGARAGWLLC